MRVAVIGATGQTGPSVVRALMRAGHDVIAIGRSEAKLASIDPHGRRVVADVANHAQLVAALEGAEAAVILSPHQLLPEVLTALPGSCRRVVASGSIRKYSRFGDAGARSARRVDAVMSGSGRDYVVLNYSMIYGGRDDRTVKRLMALVRRATVIPLPDGGRHLVQPIHVADVAAAVAAALARPELAGASIDVAGPRAFPYREMVEACGMWLNRHVTIVPLPAFPFVASETLAGWFGVTLPYIGEFARMAEDKSIDIGPMRSRLGVEPIDFAEGLRRASG